MKYITILFFVFLTCKDVLGQQIAVSDSFSTKLTLSGLVFNEPQAATAAANNRMRAMSCDINQRLEADASYLLKGENANALILYRIKPETLRAAKLSKAALDFVQMAASDAISTLSEGEAKEEMASAIPSICKTLHADWAQVSSFEAQKEWTECVHRNKGYHIMVFRAGKGYAELIVFYNGEYQNFINQELPNIITSVSFE